MVTKARGDDLTHLRSRPSKFQQGERRGPGAPQLSEELLVIEDAERGSLSFVGCGHW